MEQANALKCMWGKLAHHKSENQEKYLGNIISKDGKSTKNDAARKKRGTGIIIQIQSILEDICFGKYHFEVA